MILISLVDHSKFPHLNHIPIYQFLLFSVSLLYRCVIFVSYHCFRSFHQFQCLLHDLKILHYLFVWPEFHYFIVFYLYHLKHQLVIWMFCSNLDCSIYFEFYFTYFHYCHWYLGFGFNSLEVCSIFFE